MSAVIHSSASTAYERHPPGDLAIWIFILAELGVFALFFAAYAFARSHNVALFDEFQQHLNRRAALVNTLALITSSYFVVRAVAAIREGNRSHCVRWLLAALGLRACIWVWLVMLLLTGHPVAGYPGRADQHCLHHVVFTGMAPAWGEISFANKLLATESTEKHGIFLKCVHVFRGFRGQLPGSGSR
jgi:hypothetical protein